MSLTCWSTNSIIISAKFCASPGTPVVTFSATDLKNQINRAPSAAEKNNVTQQIIQVVQYYGGDIILGTIPIVTKYSHSEANEARGLNYRIEELCVNYGVECAAVSEKMVYDSDLYLDDLHPTLEGHKYIEAAFRIKISAVMGK